MWRPLLKIVFFLKLWQDFFDYTILAVPQKHSTVVQTLQKIEFALHSARKNV